MNLVIAALYLLRAPNHTPKSELMKPIWAAERIASLHPKALFFTSAAREELQARSPALLADSQSAENERTFKQAAQNPALFRQLDHRLHFDAVWLCGDPANYRPLLQHLLETRDWTLTYLDHTSLIFQRAPVEPWKNTSLNDIEQKFNGKDRAQFLSLAAGKLLAIGDLESAKGLLDEAVLLDKNSPEIWTQLALYDARVGHWREALAHAEQALTLSPDFVPALETKAQILFGSKHFSAALAAARKALEANPQSPETLFLHAKIAHQARAFTEEIESLNKLIALAENQQRPTSGYRLYLAQAYVANGNAPEALVEFQKLAKADDLTPEQRDFVKECIERIQQTRAPM